MNVKEMIYLLRHRVGDANKGKGIPAKIYLKVLNDAFDFVAEDNGGLFAEYTIDSAVGKYEYQLPTLIRDLEWVKYDGKILNYIDHLDFKQSYDFDPDDTTDGDPTLWYARFIAGVGKCMFLYPVPDTAADVIRIGVKIRYDALTESNYGDDITLPNYMQDAIVDYATYLLFRELQNWKAVDRWKQEAAMHTTKSRVTGKTNRKSRKL